jgi:hypothetical protein
MTPIPPFDPRQLQTSLSRAYGTYYLTVRASIQPRIMGWVCSEVLDGIETLAVADSASQIADLHRQLMALLTDDRLPESEPLRADFKRLYGEAEAIAFPATTTFIAHAQELTSWTRNLNIVTADLGRLRALDLLAHSDPTFKAYINGISAKLGDAAAAPIVTAYSQFFEVYSEALVLTFLRMKLPTARVPEVKNTQTPDFRCELEDGRSFYVEVKTLNIVGGDLRHDDMMVDAIDQAVDLENQIAEGRPVSTSEGEFAPYKRYG